MYKIYAGLERMLLELFNTWESFISNKKNKKNKDQRKSVAAMAATAATVPTPLHSGDKD